MKFKILAIALLLLIFSSTIAAPELDPEYDYTKDSYAYKKETKGIVGIYIDTVDRNASVKDSLDNDIRFKWGYNKESISTRKIATKEFPNNMNFPFWFVHDFDSPIDLCKGELSFETSYPTSLEILWDYDIASENFVKGIDSAECVEPYSKNQCYVVQVETDLMLCDVSLKDNICTWKTDLLDGTYSYETTSGWTPVSSLESCPLEIGEVYNLRHTASMPAKSSIKFDVNAIIRQTDSKGAGIAEKVIFSIDPTWTSDAPEDYNTGTGFDFNWTRVTPDANVLPYGTDRIYVEQDQTFYDNNLLIYYKFNDMNAGRGIPDDSNNGNRCTAQGSRANLTAYGMWDSNAYQSQTSGDGCKTMLNPDDLNNFSISVWFKPNIITGTRYLADTSVSTKGFILRYANDFEFYVYCGGANGGAATGVTLKSGRWYHIVATHGATNYLYIDGVQGGRSSIGYCPGGGIDDAGVLMIVGGDYSNSAGASGFIDEFKFYDRELSANEVLQDYNNWMNSDYTSPVFDASSTSSWDTISWNQTVDQNNSITVDYRSCNDSACDGETWTTGLAGCVEGSACSLSDSDNQYFQYRANFDTNRESWNIWRESDMNSVFARIDTVNVDYTAVAVDSCSCPSSGHWNIIDGDVCTLSTTCNLPLDLHIVDGSLNITSTGELMVSQGQKAITTIGEQLSIEYGGKLVVEQ